MTLSIVMTTYSGEKEAAKISDALLRMGLAACVKSSGVRSSYLWNGKIAKSSESLLMVMTTKKNVAGVMSFIKKTHSYKVPEIIEVQVKKGDKNYSRWVCDVTE